MWRMDSTHIGAAIALLLMLAGVAASERNVSKRPKNSRYIRPEPKRVDVWE